MPCQPSDMPHIWSSICVFFCSLRQPAECPEPVRACVRTFARSTPLLFKVCLQTSINHKACLDIASMCQDCTEPANQRCWFHHNTCDQVRDPVRKDPRKQADLCQQSCGEVNIISYHHPGLLSGTMPRPKRIANEAAPRVNISLDAIARTLAHPVCVDTPDFLVGISAMFTLSEAILAEEKEWLSIAPYTRFLFDPDTGMGSVVPKIHPSYETGACASLSLRACHCGFVTAPCRMLSTASLAAAPIAL